MVEAFRKRFSSKVCQAPLGFRKDCNGGIIQAHTLSVGAMLRPISRDSRVYVIRADPMRGGSKPVVEYKLIGLRDTSVFNGFCASHDRDLFSVIENQVFVCTPEQVFMYAFRAVAKESYLKRRQAESVPDAASVKAIHNLPDSIKLESEDDFIVMQASSLRGAEETERLKNRFDSILENQDWRRIQTLVLPFSRRPSVVCSSLFAPDFAFDGQYLQDFESFDKDLDHLIVTILPSASGGFALLSFLDNSGPAPRALIDSLLSRDDLTSALIWLVFTYFENHAISPDWLDSVSEETRKMLLRRFESNVSWHSPEHNTLQDCVDGIADWGPGKPFWI